MFLCVFVRTIREEKKQEVGCFSWTEEGEILITSLSV